MKSKPWLQIKNSTNSKVTEILVYGEIGDWWDSLDAASLARQIKDAEGDEIHFRMNTPGGSLITAQAIASVIKDSGKKTVAKIDGMCASAGTVISSACDVVRMPKNAVFLVHHPLTYAYGNAKDFRELADTLDFFRDTILPIYEAKTGMSQDELISLMDEDRYMNAEEAKDLGFVDEIADEIKIAAKVVDKTLIFNDAAMKMNEQLEKLPHLAELLTNKTEEVKTMDLQTLKNSHKSLHDEIVSSATQKEKERIGGILAAAGGDHAELVAEAIKNGDSAGEFAVKALAAERSKTAGIMAARQADAEQANKVTESKDPQNHKDEAEGVFAQAFLNARKGVK